MAYVTNTLKQKYCSTSKMQLKHFYQRTNVSDNTSTIYRQVGVVARDEFVQSTQQRRY